MRTCAIARAVNRAVCARQAPFVAPQDRRGRQWRFLSHARLTRDEGIASKRRRGCRYPVVPPLGDMQCRAGQHRSRRLAPAQEETTDRRRPSATMRRAMRDDSTDATRKRGVKARDNGFQELHERADVDTG
jgi:hypothetical protein